MRRQRGGRAIEDDGGGQVSRTEDGERKANVRTESLPGTPWRSTSGARSSGRTTYARSAAAGEYLPAGDLKEVWFAGVHSDVGGGYPASADPQGDLWKFSLTWVLRKAEASGLLVDDARRAKVLGHQPDPDAPRHESLVGWWRLAEFLPRNVGVPAADGTWRRTWRINPFGMRPLSGGDRVHWSAAVRAG